MWRLSYSTLNEDWTEDRIQGMEFPRRDQAVRYLDTVEKNLPKGAFIASAVLTDPQGNREVLRTIGES